ncbi:MAG: type II toxin-antitoxin system VapC family toxin [Eggerthellaceae bacterium]|nr:type II toxin-antitoxin system VapC family toxin [Eggerthellaceae bacterium]
MIVLDCNAAIGMVMETSYGRALGMLMLDGEEAIAPNFFKIEVTNTLWKYIRAGSLDMENAEKMFRATVALVGSFQDDEDLLVEALAEGARLDHPVYDMLYFVLARRHAATLFTLDQKLQKLCDENGVNCVYLDKEF